MAMKHRMTRTATRICIEALKEYLPKLAPEGQHIARELIENMTTELNHSFVNRLKQPDAAGETAPPIRWVQDIRADAFKLTKVTAKTVTPKTDAPDLERSDAEP